MAVLAVFLYTKYRASRGVQVQNLAATTPVQPCIPSATSTLESRVVNVHPIVVGEVVQGAPHQEITLAVQTVDACPGRSFKSEATL